VNYIIRKFNKSDLGEMYEMIRELAIFEKAPEKVTNSVSQMEEEMDYFECFIVENEEKEIIGMALYYYVYYTWVGKSMYLDDLVVREKYRNQGIGKELLNKIIGEAKENNCKRLRWQVLDWNEKAIDLYTRFGCDMDEEWLNCDLSFI